MQLIVLLDETRKEIGLDRNPPDESELGMEDLRPFEEYISLRDPDRRFHTRSTEACVASNIYRGIVPARNIELRDFAINGAIVSPSFFLSTTDGMEMTITCAMLL